MRIFLALFCLCISVACTSDFNEEVVLEYQPLKFNGDDFVLDREQVTERHYDRIEFVLLHYKIEYERLSSLKISFEEAISKEMAFNYTNKAKDSKWLKDLGFKKT